LQKNIDGVADNMSETVYEPNQRLKLGFFKIWFVMARNIIDSKELIFK